MQGDGWIGFGGNYGSLLHNSLLTAPKCHGDPILSKMGTQWGPNFESEGDLMGTLASRNGDPKSVFLKIDQNKPVYISARASI